MAVPKLVPAAPFGLILADPPWPFRDKGSRMHPSYAGRGREQAHYQVQTIEDIMAMGSLVKLLAARDSFLALWVPNALVIDGKVDRDGTPVKLSTGERVALAWGFHPVQLIPWVKTDKSGKPRLGGGHYTRVVTEQLILARRGKARVLRRDEPGVIIEPRGRHSAKPDETYRKLERLCAGPYLELYARRQWSERWAVYGNQIAA